METVDNLVKRLRAGNAIAKESVIEASTYSFCRITLYALSDEGF